MEEKRNAYEIVGTNKIAIDRIKDEQEKNRFIEEKAVDRTKKISREIEIKEQKLETIQSISEKILIDREIENLRNQIKDVQEAYEKIFDREHREKYNAFLEIVDKSNESIIYETTKRVQENYEQLIPEEMLNEIKNKIKKNRAKKENAYEILKTSQEKCNDKTRKAQNIDEFLLRRKEGLIELVKAEYEKKVNIDKKNEFGAIQKLKLEIRLIEGAYREIATKTKREIYNQKLAEIEKKDQEAIEEEIFKMKYDRSGNYESSSILTLKYQERILPGIIITRKNGQKVLIQQVGRIVYEDSRGIKNEIAEYEITRIIKDKKKADKVYISGLNRVDLNIDENTEKYLNQEYYNFIANEMLSEEAIEQCSKYNNGYLGEPLKDNNGNYFRYLDGREELSAVMKLYEEIKKEKDRVEKIQEDDLKREGDERE